MRIILTNNCLDQIVSHADNDNRLSDSLKILKRRKSGGSIDISDEFELQDLQQFYKLRNIIDEGEAFGNELFSGTFLDPKVEKAKLLFNILDLLVEYYNAIALDYEFVKPGDIL